MPTNPSNEFLTSLDDNRIRPYTSGMKRQEETLSTIVVYKDNNSESGRVSGEKRNYTEDMTAKVAEIIPEGTRTTLNRLNPKTDIVSGTPELIDGTIPNLKLDGETDYYGIFNNFSLLTVQEASEQIIKLHINFGAHWNAFFFGDKPSIYQFSGFFLDSQEYPYYQEFMVAYEKYLAGRKAIEGKYQVKFVYDGKIVDGYMVNISTSQTAADQLIKNFQFTVLVKGVNWVRDNIVRDGLGSYKKINGMGNKERLIKQTNNGMLIGQTSNTDKFKDLNTGKT